MKAIGFTADDHSRVYRRQFQIRSRRDIERTAVLVLDSSAMFNYRGLVPIDVEVVFGGRASEEFVYTSFAPQEIAAIAAGLGYSAQISDFGGMMIRRRRSYYARAPPLLKSSSAIELPMEYVRLRLPRFPSDSCSGEAWCANGLRRD